MKARIIPKHNVSKKEKQRLKEHLQYQTKNIMRKYFKLLCVVLNDDFGFGYKRLMKVIDELSELSEKHQTDEVFWEHIDKRVIEQIGLQFEYEDYEDLF